MEVKTEDSSEVNKQDSENDAPAMVNTIENGNIKMETSITNEDDIVTAITQETELPEKDSITPSIETAKAEMETSNANVPDSLIIDQTAEIIEKEKEIETEKDTQQNDIIKPVENTTAISKQARENIVQSTEATEDESENSTKPVNPLKRKRCRPPKRKRKSKMHRVMVAKDKPSTKEVAESDLSIDTSAEITKEDVEYCLTVSNLPNSWSFMEIKNYIDTECGPVDEIEMIKDDKTGVGAIRLSYQTEEECKVAMQKLENKEVAGNKLVLEITVVSLESDSETKSETTDATKKPWKPDLDSWEVDLQGMYGLKLQYLRSLGITPPLDKWVHVSNFRCDKSELRDVMEMAGNVQMCSVFTVTNRYANVMYSHPLEAVQAVSMLNNQMFYGQQLKVTMDRSPSNTVLLPKGLTNIGKGLGLNGKPLKNIVKHYERFVENKDCLINPAVFDIPENHSMKLNDGFETAKFEVKNVEDFNYPITVDSKTTKATPAANNTVKTVATPKPAPIQTPPRPANVQTPAFTIAQPKPVTTPVRANFTPAPVQNFQQRPFAPNFRPGPFLGPQAMNGQGMVPQGPIAPLMQGPRPPPHPSLAGPPRPPGQYVRPFPGPGGPGPAGAPRPGWGPGPGPMRPVGPMYPNEPVKLILSNLPPSTTFALLCEKMSEWGHVVCIQLTTPGCAVVTFANRMQADSCFQSITTDGTLKTILFK